jgi:uncharacterized damage-inducible protein DinB
MPDGKWDWQPHPKSRSLYKLAVHLVDIPAWVPPTLDLKDFDLATYKTEQPSTQSAQGFVDLFDRNVASGLVSLQASTEANLDMLWDMRMGDHYFMKQVPKGPVLRSFVFSHMIHHRAQLGMYLRLLDVAVPESYGPTADSGQ